MLAAREIAIRADDTTQTLQERLARLGAELIGETLEDMRQGRVREVPQPAEGATHAAKLTKAEALIDWRQDAVLISRQVRAFNPWPIAETRLDGAQLRIWEAEILDAPAGGQSVPGGGQSVPGGGQSVPGGGPLPGSVLAAAHAGIDVACGRGVLRILRLQLAGRKPLFAREFIKAQRLDGSRFASV
jgi:methionyl-tRNA formyltransferase